MHKMVLFAVLLVLIVGCNVPAASSIPASQELNQPAESAPVVEETLPIADPTTPPADPTATEPIHTTEPSAAEEAAQPVSPTERAATATETAEPEPTPLVFGPDEFPAGINPLTGLPVEDPENLALSPALVSVTNFPVTARPQAGLSYAPYVFELYIGEGMTRFLALFYGDYPSGDQQAVSATNDGIGPIRSGRLPYESLRKMYNGFLIMASASSNVKTALGSYINVFGSDSDNINSALIPATKLKEIAEKNSTALKNGVLTGNQFIAEAPANGKTANMMFIPFSYLNQVIWRYDTASGAYHRYQDNADGETYTQATDRLTSDPLTFENVVILFANHHAQAETLIDLDMMYQSRTPALLFRDGMMYTIYWTTANAEFEKTTGLIRPIRFVDEQGNPFPLKPGQTWVEIVQTYTYYNETVDGSYFDMRKKVDEGSGNWVIHFYPPEIDD